MSWNTRVEFSSIVGKTFTVIARDGEEVIFTEDNGQQYKLYHSQDCCEGVGLEDVCGDLSDLVGTPITLAEEVINSGSGNTKYDNDIPEAIIDGDWPEEMPKPIGYAPESWTWTFYKLATVKGHVTLRWYGQSNGYYSEGVDFEKIEKDSG